MLTHYFEIFRDFIEHQDKFQAAIYLIIAKSISGAAFIPGSPLTLIAGAILGTFWGTIISLVGNTVGATLAFLIARYLLKNFIQKTLIQKYPAIKNYEDKLIKNGFTTTVFLRLVPLFPFNAINFILGVTDMKFKDYIFGTMIGIIPGTIAFVYFGESIKMLNIYSIVFAILGIFGLSFVGKFWKLK